MYSVIAESGMVDTQGDVMDARTIEDMAHDFMMRFRSSTSGTTGNRLRPCLWNPGSSKKM